MSIVFAAITPHSPILLPAIGKSHLAKLRKTVASLKRLEQDLYAAQPDTILVISPHGPADTGHFTLDVNERYGLDLKEFGILVSAVTFRSDLRLASALKEQLEDLGIPFMLRSGEGLDYGSAVPLVYLTQHLPDVRILPIAPSRGLMPKQHFDFGQGIRDVLLSDQRRVAVIASADLSHRLTRTAPAGYSPFGKKFDEKVLDVIRERRASALLTFEPELAEKAAQCGLPALTVFAGILEKLDARPDVLSYESPFGIGVAAVQYQFA